MRFCLMRIRYFRRRNALFQFSNLLVFSIQGHFILFDQFMQIIYFSRLMKEIHWISFYDLLEFLFKRFFGKLNLLLHHQHHMLFLLYWTLIALYRVRILSFLPACISLTLLSDPPVFNRRTNSFPMLGWLLLSMQWLFSLHFHLNHQYSFRYSEFNFDS